MSKWSKVGGWLKDNASDGAALVGSLLTGNVAGAVAAGAALVSSATGSNDPSKVLEKLQSDPDAVLKLKELVYKNEQDVRAHIETMERLELKDQQLEHSETQQTIRAGDASTDREIRMVRPTMAKQSWIATICYCIGCFGLLAMSGDDVFSGYIAMTLFAPAGAYLGLRTTDKGIHAWKEAKSTK